MPSAQEGIGTAVEEVEGPISRKGRSSVGGSNSNDRKAYPTRTNLQIEA